MICLGILPTLNFNENGYKFGAVSLSWFISYALTDRIIILQNKKEKAYSNLMNSIEKYRNIFETIMDVYFKLDFNQTWLFKKKSPSWVKYAFGASSERWSY